MAAGSYLYPANVASETRPGGEAWTGRPAARESASARTPAWVRVLGYLVTMWLCGCHTVSLRDFPVDSANWNIQQVQAVWRPSATGPELAGDLVIGTHPGRNVLVEFSKGPLSLIAVRGSASGWVLEAPAEQRTLSGHGPPPGRTAWLVVARDLLGYPAPSGWKIEREAGGLRVVANTRTGERLELHPSLP